MVMYYLTTVKNSLVLLLSVVGCIYPFSRFDQGKQSRNFHRGNKITLFCFFLFYVLVWFAVL